MQTIPCSMEQRINTSFWQVAFTHFVPCFFVGVFLLYALNGVLPENIVTTLANGTLALEDVTIACLNGTLTAGIVWLFHRNRNRRLKRGGARSQHPVEKKMLRYAILVGFMSGALDVLLLLHAKGVISITILVVFILVCHLKAFNRHIVNMLKPGNIATWGEVSELMRIYMTMLAGFTLLNATMEGIHLLLGGTPVFGFMVNGGDIFLNAFYYTVVSMTTLGFGDIVPHTWDGKLMLIFQCLVSYIMFALMVGIITRGVVSARDNEES